MNHLCRFVFLVAALCGQLYADDAPAPPSEPGSYGTVDIARVKARHYREQGFELLPGFISDTTIGPGQFAVISDIIVGKGANLVIRPGTVIMFEPQRRLVVEGELFAAALDGATIVFTHMPHESRYIKINIVDSLWNGITVEPGGRLFLNRIVVANATTGIEVTGAVEGRIDISCVDLAKTTISPLTVNGRNISLPNPQCVGSADLAAPPPVVGDTVVKAGHRPEWELPLRIGSCTVAAGGAVLAACGFWQYRKYGRLYKQSTDPSRFTSEEIDEYRNKAARGEICGIVGAAVAALGAAGITVTFVF